MSDKSLSTCADSEPHGNFPPPFSRAREKQTGKIHARQQNHERTHGREHSGEGEDRIRDIGNEQAGFTQADATADVHRIIFSELRGQRLELSLRLRDRYAGLQSAHGEEIVRVALVDPRAPGFDRLRHHYRNKHLRLVGDLGADKSLRRDADHRERATVKLNYLAHDLWIAAEPVLPTVVTNHGNGM